MSHARADADETALLDVMRERIRRAGPMPVDAYMQICQADPEHGYWQRAGSIGASGDFITAPEISQTFGELIGLWCAVVWQGMGRLAPLRLIELGPGRGTLMRDALRAARTVPGFLDSLTVHLIETSRPLQELQHQALASCPRRRASTTPGRSGSESCVDRRLHAGGVSSIRRGDDECVPITWHETLNEVPDGPAIIVANEFLDALPIRQLVSCEGLWRERVVEVDTHGALRFATGPEADCEGEGPAPPGAILELRAAEDEVLAQLAKRQAPLTVLFIDYGPGEPTYGDTLQAVRRHVYVDPLHYPGSADLTAHVQFARLARKVRAAGLAADGPITQTEFLGALGIAERAARLMAANPEQAGAIEAGVQRLISPTGMGELFKAMAVRSRTLPPPPPFV